MGNCQVTEAAAVVVQHPGGKVDRFYWPTSAAEVMRSNPGHYVALITLCTVDESHRDVSGSGNKAPVITRFTRVRLVKPQDNLVLGQVYRLVTTQEVNKALQARKREKMKQAKLELEKKQEEYYQQQQRRRDINGAAGREATKCASENTEQVLLQEGDGDRQQSNGQLILRSRHWRPSLQSISESAG